MLIRAISAFFKISHDLVVLSCDLIRPFGASNTGGLFVIYKILLFHHTHP